MGRKADPNGSSPEVSNGRDLALASEVPSSTCVSVGCPFHMHQRGPEGQGLQLTAKDLPPQLAMFKEAAGQIPAEFQERSDAQSRM